MMTYLRTGNTVQNYIQIAITRVYVQYAFENYGYGFQLNLY